MRDLVYLFIIHVCLGIALCMTRQPIIAVHFPRSGRWRRGFRHFIRRRRAENRIEKLPQNSMLTDSKKCGPEHAWLVEFLMLHTHACTCIQVMKALKKVKDRCNLGKLSITVRTFFLFKPLKNKYLTSEKHTIHIPEVQRGLKSILKICFVRCRTISWITQLGASHMKEKIQLFVKFCNLASSTILKKIAFFIKKEKRNC